MICSRKKFEVKLVAVTRRVVSAKSEYDEEAKSLKISGEVLGAKIPEQLPPWFRSLNVVA